MAKSTVVKAPALRFEPTKYSTVLNVFRVLSDGREQLIGQLEWHFVHGKRFVVGQDNFFLTENEMREMSQELEKQE